MKQEEVQITIGKSANEKLLVLCFRCQGQTQHTILTDVYLRGDAPMDEVNIYSWTDEFQVIQCNGCLSLSFRSVQSNSEDSCCEEAEDINIYPRRDKHTQRQKDFYNLPFILKDIYIEALNSYNEQNLYACTACIRALIEGICKDKQFEDNLGSQNKKAEFYKSRN